MTEEEWAELAKLVELVRAHKVKSLETRIGIIKVHVYYRGLTTHIELQEPLHA